VNPVGNKPLWGIGARIAPPRFLLFVLVMAGTVGWTVLLDHAHWANALVRGFNLAALVFTVSLWPLSRDHTAAQMRLHAEQNDANRALVLLITTVVMLAILAAIASDLPSAKHGDNWATVKLVFTLSMAWGFTNLVFMLHYAHAFYGAPRPNDTGHDSAAHRGGFQFPGTPEPDYWDFLYFSFTAGMSFAASDVNVTCGRVRRVLVAQCLLSFIFNIGVIAFTINALSGAG
jgi:uncharacterized membrane protein